MQPTKYLIYTSFSLLLRVLTSIKHADHRVAGTVIGLYEGIALHHLVKVSQDIDAYLLFAFHLIVDFAFTTSWNRLVVVILWAGLAAILSEIFNGTETHSYPRRTCCHDCHVDSPHMAPRTATPTIVTPSPVPTPELLSPTSVASYSPAPIQKAQSDTTRTTPEPDPPLFHPLRVLSADIPLYAPSPTSTTRTSPTPLPGVPVIEPQTPLPQTSPSSSPTSTPDDLDEPDEPGNPNEPNSPDDPDNLEPENSHEPAHEPDDRNEPDDPDDDDALYGALPVPARHADPPAPPRSPSPHIDLFSSMIDALDALDGPFGAPDPDPHHDTTTSSAPHPAMNLRSLPNPVDYDSDQLISPLRIPTPQTSPLPLPVLLPQDPGILPEDDQPVASTSALGILRPRNNDPDDGRLTSPEPPSLLASPKHNSDGGLTSPEPSSVSSPSQPASILSTTTRNALLSRASLIRQLAADEERVLAGLTTSRAQALRAGHAKEAFLLKAQIEEAEKRARGLHRRAERRYYHGGLIPTPRISEYITLNNSA